MNSLERITAALRREPLDRVPTFEWLIDQKIIDVLMPGASFEEFSAARTDAVCVDINYTSEKLPDGKVKDEWGMIKEYTGEAHSFPVDGPIKSMADLEAYTPPDPLADGRFKSLGDALAKYGRNKAVVLHMNDVWSLPSRMMPFNDFICNIVDEPEFIRALVRMTVDVQIELAKQAANCGARFLYTGDDVAYNNGPMISPAVFRELFFPELKRIIRAYKDLGFLVIKHSDGYMMPLLDMYLEAGFDCLDPIDPIAGMDLKYMKENYGEVISLKGNINCATTLVTGSVDDVAEETKYCLRVAKGRSGYIASSSNSIHSSVKPENYAAMLEVIEQYGSYK